MSQMESAHGINQESGKLFRKLFDQAIDPIFLFRGHEFVDCNERAVELFDVPRQELLDHSPIYYSPESQPDGQPSDEKAHELLERTLQGDPQRFEWVHERPGGDQFKIEVNLNRIDVNGETWCQAICREMSFRQKYKRTRQFLEQTIQSTVDGILVTGTKGGIKYYNDQFLDLWDIPGSVIEQRDDDKAVEHVMNKLENPDKFEQRVKELRDDPDTESFDRIRFKDGTIVERYSRPLMLDDEAVGRVWSFRDVTEREQREIELKEARTFLGTIVRELPVMLVVKDADDFSFEICNDAVAEFFGREKDELEGLDDFEVLPEQHARRTRKRDQTIVDTGEPIGPTEEQLSRPSGQRWLVTRKVPITDSTGQVQFVLSLIQDITERKETEQELKQAEEKLRELSNTDDLTEVPNRRYFRRLFDQELSRHYRERRPLSVIMFDIDCFKTYNDHFGHPEGDRCLKSVAATLEDTVKRSSDVLARYGGEEFIALLPETESEGARNIARECLEEIRNLNIDHPKSAVADKLTISAGVATNIPQQNESSDLIENADDAMYESKRKGRDRVTVYSE